MLCNQSFHLILQAIVETNASQVHMISENHPKYIVPDTNCFIDNLEGIVQIIDSKDFNVILPLIGKFNVKLLLQWLLNSVL